MSTWEHEGWAVINTAVDLLTEPELPPGAIDPDDPSTIPQEWR